MPNNEVDELKIILQILAGETALYAELVSAHKDKLFNFIYRMTFNAQESEDIAQESFIRAYRNLKNFKVDYKFSTWLYSIARNLALNHLKRKQIIKFFSIDRAVEQDDGSVTFPEFADTALTPEESGIKKEEALRINGILDRLKPKYREILLLRYIEGLEYKEIAQITGLPIGTVENRLYRAVEKLKKLKKYEI